MADRFSTPLDRLIEIEKARRPARGKPDSQRLDALKEIFKNLKEVARPTDE